MILWLDAHISPKLCAWIRRQFGVEAIHVRDLGLRGAEDPEIFAKAREASAVVLSKDEDFVVLVERLGPPPQVICHLWERAECASEEDLRGRATGGYRGTRTGRTSGRDQQD